MGPKSARRLRGPLWLAPAHMIPRASGVPAAGTALLLALTGCILDGECRNHPPTIQSVTAEPSPVLPDSMATVSVVASDRDGDRLAYLWESTGGTFPEGTQAPAVLWKAPSEAGLCTLGVRVSDGESAVTGLVEIDVLGPEPRLSVFPLALDFSDTLVSLGVWIQNTGSGALSWSVSDDQAWIAVDPASGSTTRETDTVFVTVDRRGLETGLHGGTVTVTSDYGCADIPASVSVPEERTYTYSVVNAFPHDPAAFTQGLVFEDGFLFEGTGLYGFSTLRRVALETGDVLQVHDLDDQFFGEGITIYEDKILQLTWRSQVGFVYDKETFAFEREFGYAGEGWGLTHDGARLILSDGTSTLRFLDPETFGEIGALEVYDRAGSVENLNELEYVGGEIFANVWRTDRIARISCRTGQVLGWIDLEGLLYSQGGPKLVDVLNGIAWDEEQGRLFVTGKQWYLLFEIELVPLD